MCAYLYLLHSGCSHWIRPPLDELELAAVDLNARWLCPINKNLYMAAIAAEASGSESYQSFGWHWQRHQEHYSLPHKRKSMLGTPASHTEFQSPALQRLCSSRSPCGNSCILHLLLTISCGMNWELVAVDLEARWRCHTVNIQYMAAMCQLLQKPLTLNPIKLSHCTGKRISEVDLDARCCITIIQYIASCCRSLWFWNLSNYLMALARGTRPQVIRSFI